MLLVTFLLIPQLRLQKAYVVNKGGVYASHYCLFSQQKNQDSEHYVMMTLFKATRDIYCVKTHNTNVQLTLVLIKMEQVVTAKG